MLPVGACLAGDCDIEVGQLRVLAGVITRSFEQQGIRS
jgi:hypothetical protein